MLQDLLSQGHSLRKHLSNKEKQNRASSEPSSSKSSQPEQSTHGIGEETKHSTADIDHFLNNLNTNDLVKRGKNDTFNILKDNSFINKSLFRI